MDQTKTKELFDTVIVNDDLDEAVEALRECIFQSSDAADEPAEEQGDGEEEQHNSDAAMADAPSKSDVEGEGS